MRAWGVDRGDLSVEFLDLLHLVLLRLGLVLRIPDCLHRILFAFGVWVLHGFLAHKKQRPPRTLQ